MEPLGDSMMWTEDGDTVIGRFDGDLYEYLDPITERIVELIDLQLAIAQQERESAQSIYDGAFRLLVTSAVGVALLMVLVGWWVARDRKSTRLNSSHVAISYAVFCLKKKRKKRQT